MTSKPTEMHVEDISIDKKYKACAGKRVARNLPPDTSMTSMIDEAARVLPTQATLDRFVHQNPLMAFEDMHFDAAVAHIHKLEHDASSPAEKFLGLKGIDPRPRANEALCDLCATFLDKDSARWPLEQRDRGFLYAFATLEGLGFAPWRKGARTVALSVLQEFQGADGRLGTGADFALVEPEHRAIAEKFIKQHFQLHHVPADEWTSVLRACVLQVRGWAGLFKYFEEAPSAGRKGSHVRLVDFIAVSLILVQSSMEEISSSCCMKSHDVSDKRVLLTPAQSHDDPWRPTSKGSYIDQQPVMRECLEAQFMKALIEEVGTAPIARASERPELQVWTCIDDRMEGLRRELEKESTTTETLGVAGFFGVPVLYMPIDGGKLMTCAPVGNCPTNTVVEKPRPGEEAAMEDWKKHRQLMGSIEYNVNQLASNPFLSIVATAAVGPLSVANVMLLAVPETKLRVKKSIEKALSPPKPSPTFDLPWPTADAAKLLSTCLKDIGTSKRFAPLVVILGHGSDSVNNPFFSPHNCGACQGQHGDNNARLFARAANNVEVRSILASEYDIVIPKDTHFIGGGVNTATSNIFLHDICDVPETHADKLFRAQRSLNYANAEHCIARTQHLFLEPHNITQKKALAILDSRGTNIAEIRPELSHSTNAGVVVGRRDLTKGKFFDCRTFLLSYDPFMDDETGTSLQRILTPALVVCSGINLEYLFSAGYDGHGSGTKCPMNTVSNIAVMQGTIGDVKTGLPTQMTEMHIPIRLQFLVDAPVARVEAVLSRNIALERLVRNEWVQMVIRDPFTDTFYKLHGLPGQGRFVPVPSMEVAPNRFKLQDGYTKHKEHGYKIKAAEDPVYYSALLGLPVSWLIPVLCNSELRQWSTLTPEIKSAAVRGSVVAAVATAMTYPILVFSRRYLHGEYMYTRYFALCFALLLGFNWVATSPDPMSMGAGYSLLGFASTFLIGMYNERPTVRANACFAFMCYKLGDLCMMLGAASFYQLEVRSAHGASAEKLNTTAGAGAALALLGGAFFKSSQFPVAALFAMSMEGPTPSSALGYAGISGHIGIVMLATQMPIWFHFTWARALIGLIGAFTTIYSSLISQTLADRKGAIAYAISASVGQLYIVLAIGWNDAALVLALAHASFRISQVLNVGGQIKDDKNLKATLDGHYPLFAPTHPPTWLYKLAWFCRRLDRDLMEYPRSLTSETLKTLHLSAGWQYTITFLACVFGALPDICTTLIPGAEHALMNFIKSSPFVSTVVFIGHAVLSVMLIRFVFYQVLDLNRFDYSHLKGVEEAKKLAESQAISSPLQTGLDNKRFDIEILSM